MNRGTVTLGVACDWKLSRKAQLHLSRELGKPGLLVFTSAAGNWGYEFFDSGRTLDHFVRRYGSVPIGFPVRGSAGKPDVLDQLKAAAAAPPMQTGGAK